MASKGKRKAFVNRLGNLLAQLPMIQGIDIDWEAPSNEDEWRDLAKAAQHMRAKFKNEITLSATYHPYQGTPKLFKELVSSKTGEGLVDLFDFVHCMAYGIPDKSLRHSTLAHSKKAIEEWTAEHLPASSLTLGVPFYGRSRSNGEAKTYGEIVDSEPTLKLDIHKDETNTGVSFNNGKTLQRKVHYAMRLGLAGVMIWELGQDKAASDINSGSLLRQIRDAVNIGPQPGEAAGEDEL